MTPILVFTDLDSTLLNHDDYSYAEALPALQQLHQRDIPLMLVSSKTVDEMLALRRELNNQYPFVCENGSLVVIPEALLGPLGVAAEPQSVIDGYYYAYRGATRLHILEVLASLREEYDFTGFAQMTIKDLVACTGLSAEAAELASRRSASEPILWRDSDKKKQDFKQALAGHQLRLLKGGRFYHVMGLCDKGDAVRYLQTLYRHQYRARPFTIALGDSPNDLDMLKQADVPVVMPHKDGSYMQDDALKKGVNAPCQGARGWNAVILQLLASQSG